MYNLQFAIDAIYSKLLFEGSCCLAGNFSLSLIRTCNLHHLLNHLMKEPGLLRISSAVINLLPLAVTGYKAAVAKGTQMVRNSRAGHVQHRGKIQDTFLAVTQNPENADPVGVT